MMNLTKRWVESIDEHFNFWLGAYTFMWLGIGIIIGISLAV